MKRLNNKHEVAETGKIRKKLFGIAGHTNGIEEVVETTLGTILICSLPGEAKQFASSEKDSTKDVRSEDFVFIGSYGSSLYVVVGDGVTNKGRGGLEAARICYETTRDIWEGETTIAPPLLFERWHQALISHRQASVAITVLHLEPFRIPQETELIVKARFYSSGDVSGILHTPLSRYNKKPFYETDRHRTKSGKLSQAVSGRKRFEPEIGSELYCMDGDVIHCFTDGVDAFSEELNAVLTNRKIGFQHVPLLIQGELYFTMMATKSEHSRLVKQVENNEVVDPYLLEKYGVSGDRQTSLKINTLDDMTSIICQIKTDYGCVV